MTKIDSKLNVIHDHLLNVHKVSNQEFTVITNQIYDILNERKSHNTERCYLELIVNYYLETLSERVFKILIGISPNLHDPLFGVIQDKVKRYASLPKRHSVLILLSNMVHLSQHWLYKLINPPLLNDFINAILKNESEIVMLGTSTLLLIELIVTMPSTMTEYLDEIFVCFNRLSTFLYKKINATENNDLYFYTFNSIVYRLFIRLYAIYPCNFIEFLRTNYGHSKDKRTAVFNKVIQPMLSRIRFHPLLVVASKDKECDKSRWRYKEPHDILDDCNQYTLDSIESIQESDISEHDCLIYNPDDKIIEDFINEKFLLSNDKYDQNPNVIFSQLNAEINRNPNMENICMLGCSSSSIGEAEKSEKESRSASIEENKVKSPFSKEDKNIKNLLAPVPISADSKHNLNYMQRKSSNKAICSSPFKPIKENDTLHSKSDFPSTSKLIKSSSPMLLESRDSTSSVGPLNENEEVDLEIVKITERSENSNSGSQLCEENEICLHYNSKNKNRKLQMLASSEKDSSMGNAIPAEEDVLSGLKTSHPARQSRIRYQSYCLPQTAKDECSFDPELSDSMPNLHHSKSCPILYFKRDYDEATDDEKGSIRTITECSEDNSSGVLKSDTASTEAGTSLKSKVNLILDNPDTDGTVKKSLKETCKSVDFSKEARLRGQRFNKYSSLNIDLLKASNDSNLSIDMSLRKLNSSLNYSPHELLENVLLINSEFCIKELNDRSKVASEMVENLSGSRRNSLLVTNSNASSFEHIPSMIYVNKNEEDMPKLLAIMYNMLVFERHQRDSHVLRNRRLFKKTNECEELTEKNRALQMQIQLQEEEIKKLRMKIDTNLSNYCNKIKSLNNQIIHLEELLDESNIRCKELDHIRISLERNYRKELSELNKNYHEAELELNRYLCIFGNKNIDLVQLEKENSDLRNQLFLFGEFYEKIRDSYRKTRDSADAKDELLLNSLRSENRELNDKLTDTMAQLELYKDKCVNLEIQMKADEARLKNSSDTKEIDTLRDCLKMKDNQVNVLRSLIVNYDNHIKKLNAEIQLQQYENSSDQFNRGHGSRSGETESRQTTRI